jgi:hypothetical protein
MEKSIENLTFIIAIHRRYKYCLYTLCSYNFFLVCYPICAIIQEHSGDLNDGRKEGTQSQVRKDDSGVSVYRSCDYAHVSLKM